MFDTILPFVLRYKYIFLFYLVLIIFLYIKRKKLIIQGKIIILYRMKFGLKYIEKISQKYREWIILLGYIGVGVGYIGLIFISYMLIVNLYTLLTTPSAISGVALVLPGINIPGLGILPFWDWILAIFLIATIHEFGHCIVARAHNLEVKSTGLVFLGPIIGAFVEPDEKKIVKEKDIVQYSIFAAGPFMNILLALFAFLLLSFLFVPLQDSMVEQTGFTFSEYVPKEMNGTYPAQQTGLPVNTLITRLNDQELVNFESFAEKMYCLSPGDQVQISTENKTYPLILANNPDNPAKSFLGIQKPENQYKIKEKYSLGIAKIAYYFVDWFTGFLRWLFLLSLGIGLFNLLPLPIVDGGRMMQITMHKLRGKEKGEKGYRNISFFFLIVLLLSLFYPWISRLIW